MKRLVAIGAFLMATVVAMAQRTPGVDARERMQRMRIQDGRLDGDLTRREAHRLRMEQRHIHRMERRAKADGQVTRFERRRLHHAQNQAGRHIRRQRVS